MEILRWFNDNIVWGVPTLALFLFTGGYFTLRTVFFQLRYFGHCLKSTIFSSEGRRESEGGITQFQAMTAALAATLGTGNIAGVSAAIAVGGAGAVFWMWLSSLLGMMTGYAENVLGIYYRRKVNGSFQGGAMGYIGRGLAEIPSLKRLARPLAVVFAVLCMLTAFGMGNMAQMNTAATSLEVSFGINPLISGLVLAAAAAIVIFGGTKRIAGFTEKVVPLMSLFYIAGSAYILITNIERLPSAVCAVFEGAFGIDSVVGGINGYVIKQAVSMGLRRGVFSNEAGLGTSVAAHTSSEVEEPCIQGMWSIFEVFFDTIIMCSVTAFVLLCSPCKAPDLSECINNISLEPQYFRLTEESSLITPGALAFVSGSGEPYECRTIYGTEFTLYLSDGEPTFSNLMRITGIQSTDSSGAPLYKDGIPLIETAEIAPVSGVELATYAFSQTFGGAAAMVLSAAVALFAFSTVIGWSQFGAGAVVYLFGARAVGAFRVLFIAAAAIGAVARLEPVWELSDTFNGLMALPNLFAVLCLSPKVLELTSRYKIKNGLCKTNNNIIE